MHHLLHQVLNIDGLELNQWDSRYEKCICSLREGYELVRADEYPDSQFPVIEDGKYSGVIGVGGLLLARIPEELVKQRQEYYANSIMKRSKLWITI